MEYSLPIKNARLGVVRDALNGGRMEIFSDSGARIAAVALDKAAGIVAVGSLVFNGFPKFGMAETGGKASAAILAAADGSIIAQGLTVGVKDADVILENVNANAENVVKITSAEIRHA